MSKRRIEHGCGLGKPPQFPQRISSIAKNAQMAGIAGQGFIEGGQGVGETAQIEENIAPKKERLKICRLLLQKRVASRERFVETAKLMQRRGRTVERFAISWRKPKGGFEAFASPGVFASSGEDCSAIVPCRCI